MKKTLIASGCSFTDYDFSSDFHPDMDCSWQKWPELLAEKLNMNFINLGQSGAGNEYTYASLLDKIHLMDSNDIGLVIPAWTQSQRKDIKVRGVWKHLDQVRRYPYDKNKNLYGDITYRVEESIKLYYSFQEICKSKNIPVFQFQMLPMFRGFDYDPITKKHIDGRFDIYDNLIKTIYYNPYYKNIDNSFLGWPTESSLGGFNIKMDVLHGYNNESLKYQVSDIDSHPNTIGQIKIAEFLYEQING